MWLKVLVCLSFVATVWCTDSSTPLPIALQFNPPPEVVYNSSEVTETQHATCYIFTERIAATARATVTRALKGVCNSRELENHFHKLETQLADQVNVIKAVLLKIEEKVTKLDDAFKKSALKQTISLKSARQIDKTVSKENLLPLDENEQVSDESLPDGPRNSEIHKYNYTLHVDSFGKHIFTYYWKVDNINYKLTGWNQNRFLRSPSFYINNTYRMYLKIFPRQNEENTYVHVGLTHGVFDDNLQWPFRLKTRISVMDQNLAGLAEDISSRIWNPQVLCSSSNWQKPASNRDNYECVGLGFSLKTLRSKKYIVNDSMIIKLSVFLE